MQSFDVFTPPNVSLTMASYLPDQFDTLLEPSVGTGNLLNAVKGRYRTADVYDINIEYLNQIESDPNVRKVHANFIATQIDTLYDAILMNPPYHRYQEMSGETRAAVQAVSSILTFGNIDLYVAFLVKCMGLLTPTGTLVAIVPSTWMYNVSCKRFREYLHTHRLIRAIHDYGSTKVFPGVNVYCCILVLDRTAKTSYLRQDKVVAYEDAAPALPRSMLSDACTIQNGIATLCDSVFIHDAALFGEPCWKAVVKVSKGVTRYIIYPYDDDGNVILEEEFKRLNPQTHAYLLTQKVSLANRDRGHKTYETWYAFGRKQGIKIPPSPQSVYISTLSSPDLPVTIGPTALFYSGIRMTPSDGFDCESIAESIAQNRQTVLDLCSKRSSNWVNVTTSALKQVPITQADSRESC